MSGRPGRRAWGNIKRQRTRQPSYQASFVGPDLRRHYAPGGSFSTRHNAEGWLLREKDHLDACRRTGERWRTPGERASEKRAVLLRLSEYGKTVIDQRVLRPRTRIEYESKWSKLIEPKLGRLAVSDLTTEAVRAWFASLDPKYPTRNGHAYSILSMICTTAVRDGLLQSSPCDVRGAINPKARKKVTALTTVELHAIADKLGADERYARFKAVVLLAGWCGMRFGEVTELRRKDFNSDCTVVTVSRAVTHRVDPNTPDADRCRIDDTKNGEERSVTIPPHIKADVQAHLANYVGSSADSLLFMPVRRGCHLNDRVFNKDVLKKAAKDVGREDLSAHDLRRFAGSRTPRLPR